jgi:hypothetical protein
VDVLGGLVVEELKVLVGLAQEGEENVLDESLDVGAQVLPGSGRLDALVHEGNDVGLADLGQPALLGNPELNLGKVGLENLGGESLDESLSKVLVRLAVSAAGNRTGVSVAINCQFLVPIIRKCSPDTYRTNKRLRFP